ncbi:MAG TPA: hypothetical protein VG538_06405 [Vicinamibacterales bacterium]|nr:hypothetical protein [Vicinamibacterales bacterium]
MPFIRSTRDKRGYETTYVMHAYRPAQGPARTRVLYLFRCPTHLRVGRRPLDEEAREALTHTHPDLVFDWAGLAHDVGAAALRVDPPSHPSRPSRNMARRSRPSQADRADAPPVQASVVEPEVDVDDRSALAEVVGAAEAARLRGGYADLVTRIARRARTPEDRDRLMARVERLNPGAWSDEATVRAALPTVEADWAAVDAELPSRRRGRRGGRRRHPSAGHASQASAIMPEDGNDHAREDAQTAGADVDGGTRDDGPAGGAAAGEPAGDGVPGDDELRLDRRPRS